MKDFEEFIKKSCTFNYIQQINKINFLAEANIRGLKTEMNTIVGAIETKLTALKKIIRDC